MSSMLKYLTEREGYPGYFRPARCVAAADHFRSTLGGAFLDAVPQVEETTARSAGRRHSAGGKCRQRRLDLWAIRLLLLLSVELDGMLLLERVQVGDGLLQVDVDPRQLLLGAVHGLGGELLPGVMCGHRPGGDSRWEEVK